VSFRLILHPKMEGRLDMAVDEALAEAAGNGSSPPVVRLYGFSPPTLSLGRFQRIKGLLDSAAASADGVTVVRRPTGGHAVLHDDELTYSVIMSKGDCERLMGSSRKRAVYQWVAAVLLKGLENLGISGVVNAAQVGDVHNPDCFGSAGEYEIATTGGRKLIGSAQMTTRSAVLQHGSIPLANPGKRVFRYIRAEEVPESLPPSSLREETGRPLTYDEVRDAFSRAIRGALGAEESELNAAEWEAAARILAARYSTDGWNLMH
jgi:lipoyl(octanoyl) transferase